MLISRDCIQWILYEYVIGISLSNHLNDNRDSFIKYLTE